MAEVYLDDEGIDWSKIPDDVDDKGIDWSKIPDSESKPVQVPTLDEVAGMFSESQGKPFDKRYVADLFALSEATGLYPDVLHDVRPELESRMFQVGRGDTIFTDAAKRQFYLPNAKQVEKEAFKSFKSKTKAMQTMDLIEVYGRYRDEDNGRQGLQAVWDAETISQLKRLDLPDKFYFSPLHMRDALGADLDKFLSTVGIEPVVFSEAVKNNIPLVIHATDMMSTKARGYQEKLRPIFHEDTDHIPGPDLTAKRAVGAVGEAGKDYARNSLIAQKAKIDSFLANDVGSDVLRDPGLSTELVEGMLGSTVGAESRTKLKEVSAVLGDMAQKIERDPKYLESSGLIEDLLRQTPQMAASMATYLITAGIVRGGVAGLAKLAGPLYEAGTVAKVAGAVGSTTSTGLMFDQVFGGTIDELTRAGVPEDRIMSAALVNAVIQTPLEMVGLKGILKSFPSLGSQLGKVLFNIGEAVGKESLTEGLQEYSDEWSKLWAKNGDATTGELVLKALKQLPETTKNAAYSALIGGIMGGVGATVGAGVTALSEVRQRKTTLDQFMTIIDELKRKVEKQGIVKGVTPAESVGPGGQGEGEIPVASPINIGIPESDEGRTKAPVGYQPPPGRTLDDEVELVKAAMAHIESGGKYDVRDKTGGQGYGKYQYEPGTWEDFSKEYTQTLYQEATVLPMTPENQENVTDFKVRQWLEQGYSPRQIAARWNSGSANWHGKTGRNKKSGAYYDVPRHVRRFEEAYNAIASGKSVPMMREDIARSLGQHRNLDPRQVDKLMGLMDAAAASWAETYGREADEWYGSAFADVEIGSGEYGRGLGQVAPEDLPPAIKKKLEGTQVVDKSGKLLPQYHGTYKSFEEFQRQSELPVEDIGFHFGTSYQAESRLEQLAQRKARTDKGKSAIFPEDYLGAQTRQVYLAIKNPLEMYDAGTWNAQSIDTAIEVYGSKSLTKKQKDEIHKISLLPRSESTHKLRDYLTSQGFDGIKYKNIAEGSGTSYIAFSPDQIVSALSPEGKEVTTRFTDEELKIANATSRATGAVGAKAITPKYVAETSKPGDTILDFGAGKAAAHTLALREQGLNVVAHEFGANAKEGLHDPSALSRQYSTVYASNVLNVQSSKDMLGRTIEQIKAVVAQNGRVVANFPSEPRKLNMTSKELIAFLKDQFETVERVGGTSTAPLLEMTGPIKKAPLESILKIMTDGEYEYYGLRVTDTETYKPGDTLKPSREWADEEPTGNMLEGTSAISIGDRKGRNEFPLEKAAKTTKQYMGKKVMLIGSDDLVAGMDDGEGVFTDPKVLAVFDKKELIKEKAAPEIIQRDTGEFVRQKDVDQATVDQLKADLLARRARTQELEQRQGTRKGAVEFLDDGRAILRLFETADVTTIVHEVAHILRKQLSSEDLFVIEQWAGVKEGQWIDLDLMRQSDEARARGDIDEADRLAREAASAEEKFARAFERYVMDGKAPTWKLKEVFAKLKKWMLDVYKAVTAIDVDIPDDVRGVFDRLLSTEAQRKNNILYQMDDDYSWVEPATEEIPIESMDSYEKVSAEAARRAHLQVERQIEKKRKVREAQWRKEAIQQLAEDPMWMLVSHVRQSGGINLESVRNQFGSDVVKALARRFPGIIQEGGKVTLDELAADYGYVGDDALAQAIIDFPTKAEYVDSYIESMGKEYEESDEDELLEWQERYVEAEIEIFNKLLGPEFKREEKAPKGIKQKIREMTGQIKVGTALEGGDYQNLVRGMKMASRAAKTAFLQGKIDGARKEKIRQRDIMQRARVMLEAKKEAKKIQKELQKWVKAKNIDHEYKEQLATLLSPYEFKTRSKRTQARLDSLQAFIDRMEAEGEAVNIPKGLLERLTKKPIGQLTLAELRELHDVAAQIVHLGKLKKQLIDRKAKRDFDTVMRIVLDTIQQKARSFEELPGRPLAPSERRKDSAVGRLFQKADSWHTQLLQVEFLIRMLDGFEEMGPCYRELFLPIKHAEDEKWILLERIAKKWDEIRAPVRDEMARWSIDRVEVPGFGRMLTREEHLMIALHSRHEDNIRALTGGNKYTDAERQAILDSLSPVENEFLDKIVNELIPIPKTLLQDTHKKLHGVPLRMVQGAYVPMKFDREASDFIEEKQMTAEAMKYFKDYFAGVYMEKGMTIERKGGKQPLLLSFSAIFEHLSDTVQFATHGLPVRNLLKIFENRAFKETVKMAHGENVLDQFKPWLKEVASPGAKPLLPLEGLLGKIRKNAVLFIMAYRFSTAIQQPLALLNAVDELGGGPVLEAAALYLSDWANQRENIRALSPAIRNRASSFERDIAAATREFDITKAKWREGYEKSAFVLTAFLDGIAAEITWLGAYTEAINGKVANIGAGSEARAIDYADGVVNRTQGSGTSKNLAMISRGGEAHKLFLTFFMTFFNTNHNRLWESYQKLRLPGYEYNFLDFAKSIMLVVIVPAILSNLVSGEESEPGGEMAKSVGRYLVSGIPIIREGVAAATGYQYRGGLLGSVMNEAYMLGKTVASDKDKQKAWHLMNRFLKIGGLTTGFPPDQALIILNAAMEDKNKSFSLWDLMSRRTHRE